MVAFSKRRDELKNSNRRRAAGRPVDFNEEGYRYRPVVPTLGVPYKLKGEGGMGPFKERIGRVLYSLTTVFSYRVTRPRISLGGRGTCK
jgi:hypothetical protein